MCNPAALAVTSLLATAGSALANNQQQEAQRSAMKKAEGNYTERLGGIQNQADAVIRETTGKFGADAQAEQMAAQKDAINQQMRENIVPVASAGDVTAKSSNQVVGDVYNKVADTAYQQGLAHGNRAATLGQWQNNRFLNNIALANSGQRIGQLSNFAQGWAPVYQAEMNAAKGAGSGWGTLGSVLGGIGTVSGIGAGAMGGGGLGSLFGAGEAASPASQAVGGSLFSGVNPAYDITSGSLSGYGTSMPGSGFFHVPY